MLVMMENGEGRDQWKGMKMREIIYLTEVRDECVGVRGKGVDSTLQFEEERE